MLPKKRSPVRIFLQLFFTAACLIAALLVVTNRQQVLDQIWVWQYHPTSEVSSLVERAGMNSRGEFLYDASQPQIEDATTFNQSCQRTETATAILGCYSGFRIYIYNITNTQLDGIREVTAAHETLHAAYQRLSTTEQNNLNKLLEAEYTKLESDPDYKARMAYYAKAEPGERDNELHSVIGTEVANISPELENYYSKYFTNRQAVVSLSVKYKSVFDSLTTQASELGQQLTTLSSTIKAESATYNTDVATLNADIQAFNAKAMNNTFTSSSQFNSQRSNLSYRVTVLDQERTKINNDIATYNTMLSKYNAIATQSQQLYNSIDSSLQPAPSV